MNAYNVAVTMPYGDSDGHYIVNAESMDDAVEQVNALGVKEKALQLTIKLLGEVR